MKKKNVKNIIVGFGKGGKTLAKFLAQNGEEVVVIEQSKSMYGGTCINIGCIPSKSLIVNSEKAVKFDEAVKIKSDLTAKLNQKNYHMIADEMTADIIDGSAHFISDNEIEISSNDGQILQVLTGERIFINTGAKPMIPELSGIEHSKNILTSTELMDLGNLPEKIVIIGSGYIGLEFASMLANYGAKVTVIDEHESFLPKEDEEMSARIKADLESSGIEFILGAEISALEDVENQTIVHLGNSSSANVDDSKRINSQESVAALTADKILVATGRSANTEKLGLENTSVKLGVRGEILVNEKLETSAKNIWAIGDVHGGAQFTYTSLDDFRIIQNQLYGDQTKTLKTRGEIPTSLFITPTFSSIGYNEKTAKAAGIPYKLFKLEATAIPKSAILRQAKGLLKALVNPETLEILGAQIYAEESHETINLFTLVMKAKLPYTVLRDQIFTHPTMSEALNDLFK